MVTDELWLAEQRRFVCGFKTAIRFWPEPFICGLEGQDSREKQKGGDCHVVAVPKSLFKIF